MTDMFPSQSKGYNQPYGYPMNCNLTRQFIDMTEEDRKCLEERKYWCFMLSRYVSLPSPFLPFPSSCCCATRGCGIPWLSPSRVIELFSLRLMSDEGISLAASSAAPLLTVVCHAAPDSLLLDCLLINKLFSLEIAPPGKASRLRNGSRLLI